MNADQSLPFPLGHGKVTTTTRSGRVVGIRHIMASDDTLLIDLFNRLSLETRRLRFFAPWPDMPKPILQREAHRLSDIDPLVHAALIGTVVEDGQEHAVGVARMVCDTDDSSTAEVAIVIRDDYQRDGLGTVLLDLLIQVALVRGLCRLRGLTLVENVGVQQLFRKTGLPFSMHTSRGETTMILSLSDEPTSRSTGAE